MTSRLSRRALVTTFVGILLLVGGTLVVANGLTHRYASAQSAITIHRQKPPADLNEYTYYSFEGDGSGVLDDNLSSIIDSISDLLLSDAEASGSFEIPRLDVYVEDSSLVAVSGAAPGYRSYGYGTFFQPWTPHAYMIAPFIGGLITFAGLFWMAARWHVTASVPHREIDETPL
ncbi:hypothetical protein [Paramicrobacterium chengjingii]|uniref:DUF3592 domain-containing protein n=1 Tax=Paramicrobacterium chengjingii TaxID=2769067 RepID=A0ABX6YK01_9MICO|nr:hypothetical protein [Microbacterium chengjingii]QPZ38965.1 hypothetical protein HCR76_02360 [Microbacterium chengjingii]